MRKSIVMIAVLLLTVIMLFAVPTAVRAETVACNKCTTEKENCKEGTCECCRAQITKANGEVVCYDTLNAALYNAEDGETVKVLKSFKIGDEENLEQENDKGKGYILLNTGKNVTLDLHENTITNGSKSVAIAVDSGSNLTITGNGTVKANDGAAVLIANGTVTIENGTFEKSANDFGGLPAIQVGGGGSLKLGGENSKATLIINNGTILLGEESVGIKSAGPESNIDIKNVTIKENVLNQFPFALERYAIWLDGHKDSLIIENCDISTSGCGILVGVEPEYNEDDVYSIDIRGGNIRAGSFGLRLSEGSTTLKMTGGTMASDYSAICTDEGIIDTHITIGENAILESTKSQAISQGHKGSLTIEGNALVKGTSGITVYEGDVFINGGKVEGTKEYNSSKPKVQPAAIEVDNSKTQQFSGKAKVHISGGQLISSGLQAVTSVAPAEGREPTVDYEISGGEFNKPFDQTWVIEDLIEVKVGDTYYVGPAAENKLATAVKEPGNEIEVLQGSVDLTDVVDGVKIKNSGNGKVTANGVAAEKDKELDMTIENLKLEIERLQEAAGTLQSALDEANNKNSELSNKLTATDEELTKTKNDLNEVQDTLDTLKETTVAKEEFEKVVETLGKVQKTLADLQKQYAELLKEYEKLNANQENPADQNTANSDVAQKPAGGELDDEVRTKTGYVESIAPSVMFLISTVGAVVSKKYIK